MASFFDKAKAAVTEKAEAVKETVDEKTAPAREKASEAASEAKTAFDDTAVGRKVDELKQEADAKIEAFKEEKRKIIMEFLAAKINSIFDHGMNVAAETLKEKIKDPYMPEFVKDLCDDFVDGVWPDVKMELKDEILKGISEAPPIHHGEENCPCSPVAFFRYSILPYDRGFWRQIRNPFWWLFNLAAVFPKWGVGQITYMIHFLFIDKSDEFQLYQFIVDFKSLQFLSLGVFASILGSIQYYICVSKVPATCDKESPRESFWTMAIFFAQVIVVFIAFGLMNCAEKKGGFYYQLEQDSKSKNQAAAGRAGRMNVLDELSKGDVEMDEKTRMMNTMRYQGDQEMLESTKSRLMNFLIYDLIIFILCVGLICFAAFYNGLDQDAEVTEDDDNIGDGNWKFTMTLFWIKCFYGYMSFPFAVLRLPLISTLISHARPTGYNPYGNTVPFVGEEEQRPVPWDPSRQPPEEEV